MYNIRFEVKFKICNIRFCVGYSDRAKTIKNAVTVNEELTAEEWKRRYEKEREKALRYKTKLEIAEAELTRWRSGESVGQEEQVRPNSFYAIICEEILYSHLI